MDEKQEHVFSLIDSSCLFTPNLSLSVCMPLSLSIFLSCVRAHIYMSLPPFMCPIILPTSRQCFQGQWSCLDNSLRSQAKWSWSAIMQINTCVWAKKKSMKHVHINESGNKAKVWLEEKSYRNHLLFSKLGRVWSQDQNYGHLMRTEFSYSSNNHSD